MMRVHSAAKHAILQVICVLGLIVLSGCDAAVETFVPNRLQAEVAARRHQTQAGAVADQVAALMTEMFGTPDQPLLPAGFPADLLDLEKLQRAAGPKYSDENDVHFGTFRAFCAVCHGVAGDGAGPAAALQNPYPRDFRAGVFKFKSTPRDAKPTKDDVRQLLLRGEPGTSMPTFSRLPENDIDALVEYVVYLSIRGEVERRLIAAAASDWSDEFAAIAAGDSAAGQNALAAVPPDFLPLVDQAIQAVASQWQQAAPLPIPPVPQWDLAQQQAAAQRGRDLFHGQLANCASCHGPGGDGGAITLDFDDWTKEFTTQLAVSPGDRAAVRPLRRLGALPPRVSQPRQLTWGAYRGADDWSDLYRRLVTGIPGTPMPGLLINQEPGGNGLEPEQVWDLVAYLKSIQPQGLQQTVNAQPVGDELQSDVQQRGSDE